MQIMCAKFKLNIISLIIPVGDISVITMVQYCILDTLSESFSQPFSGTVYKIITVGD